MLKPSYLKTLVEVTESESCAQDFMLMYSKIINLTNSCGREMEQKCTEKDLPIGSLKKWEVRVNHGLIQEGLARDNLHISMVGTTKKDQSRSKGNLLNYPMS